LFIESWAVVPILGSFILFDTDPGLKSGIEVGGVESEAEEDKCEDDTPALSFR
jgi:hypothetical protein